MGARPLRLDAEQVSLTGQQFDCGVQNDLWDAPSGSVVPGSTERSVAHLLAAGKALHFDDDVVVAEPGYHQPYVQIRGDFMLQLGDVGTIKDIDPDTKEADGKLAVIVPNMCFPDPLPVLGVRKGKFSQDVNPVMQFRYVDNNWQFTKLVH